jgi:hypothetical protein
MLEGAAASMCVTTAFMKLHEPIFRATDGKCGTSLCEKRYSHSSRYYRYSCQYRR